MASDDVRLTDVQRPRLAVLVDGDQHFTTLGAIRATCSTFGEIAIPRSYADWDDPSRAVWRGYARRTYFECVPQKRYGVNSTDHAMIVDAMRIFYEQKPDGFCLISNDRGFVPLLRHLKKARKLTAFFGPEVSRERYPEEFRAHYFASDDWAKAGLAPELAAEATRIIRAVFERGAPGFRSIPNTALKSFADAYAPDFDPHDFGFKTLLELIEKLDAFTVERPGNGQGDPVVSLRDPQFRG